MNVANTMAIRLQNALNIINDLECNKGITNTEIAHNRSLSIPTISNIINILKNSDMVVTAGIGESSGGRKPNYLTLNSKYRYFIGASIAKHTVYMVLIDFSGEILEKQKHYVQFEDNEQYWKQIRDLINDISKDIDGDCEIGIALPGFVQKDEGIVSGTDTLGVSSVLLDHIYTNIDPNVSVNDSCALAAKAQIFGKRYIPDSFYVLLSRRVSGTLIFDRSVFKFRTSSIDIGAMLIDVPEVEGRHSFYEQCSASSIIEYLRNNHSSVIYYEDFFSAIDNGDEELKQVWDFYLRKLSVALYNVYSIFKVNVVIGGEMAKYIEPYSQQLSEYVNELHKDLKSEIQIQCSGYGAYDDAFGAALEARADYLNHELPEVLKNATSVTPQRVTKKKKL